MGRQAAVRDFLAFHVAKLAFESAFHDQDQVLRSGEDGNRRGPAEGAAAAFLEPVVATLEVVTGKGNRSIG